jgi:hypothetical protein
MDALKSIDACIHSDITKDSSTLNIGEKIEKENSTLVKKEKKKFLNLRKNKLIIMGIVLILIIVGLSGCDQKRR